MRVLLPLFLVSLVLAPAGYAATEGAVPEPGALAKAVGFEKNIAAWYTRDGLLTRCQFEDRNVPSRDLAYESNGMLTAFYVAAEAWRFQATGDGEAMARLRAGIAALRVLSEVTGVPHLPAQAFRKGRKIPPDWQKTGDIGWMVHLPALAPMLIAVLFAATALDEAGLLATEGKVLVDNYLVPVAGELKNGKGILRNQGRPLPELSLSPDFLGTPVLAHLALFQLAWYGMTARATADPVWTAYLTEELLGRRRFDELVRDNWRLNLAYKRSPRSDLFFLAFYPARRTLSAFVGRDKMERSLGYAWDEGKGRRELKESDNVLFALVQSQGGRHRGIDEGLSALFSDYPAEDRKPVYDTPDTLLSERLANNPQGMNLTPAPLRDAEGQAQDEKPLRISRRYRNGFIWAENPYRYELQARFPWTLLGLFLVEPPVLLGYEGYPAVDYLLVYWWARARGLIG